MYAFTRNFILLRTTQKLLQSKMFGSDISTESWCLCIWNSGILRISSERYSSHIFLLPACSNNPSACNTLEDQAEKFPDQVHRIEYIVNFEGKKEGRARIPGVGGVEPREGIPLSPRFPEDPPRVEYRPFVPRAALACNLKASSFTGDGMKPTSQFSFTSLPIHQLLSYFSWKKTQFMSKENYKMYSKKKKKKRN